jgi:hypothetical protein
MQVSGDVFLGRYFDNEEDFKRMDFTQADLSSAAPWVREARAQLMQQLRQQQPAASGGSAAKPQSPSEVEKNKGNEVGTNWKPRDEVQEPMLVMGSGSSS